MVRSALLCLAATAVPLHCVHAQTPPVQREYTRQFQGASATFDLQSQPAAPDDSTFDGTATGDDAFGEQVILKRAAKRTHFSAFAEVGAFVTNNVALAKRDEQEDRFFVATTSAAYSRPVAKGLRLNAGAQAALYRYNEFRELDFQSTDLSAGVTWTAPVLSGLDISARYGFTDLTTAERTREFYKNHAILLGVQKTIPFSRAHMAYFGVSSLWSFADPKPAGRDEYVGYAGYRALLTRRVDAELYYRYGRYVYRSGEGRRDDNHAGSISFRYRPADWLSLSVSSFVSANRSNRSAFDYDVGNVGATVQCSVQF